MRGVVATGAALLLVACSPPEPPAESSAAEGASAPALTASAPDPSSAVQPGSGLRGEVSGLSGEVTDFRVQQTATSTIVEIASDVLFAFDSAELSAEAPARLNRAADLIRQGGPGPIEVRGYTDDKGEAAYNLGLSERRAQAVAGWLRSDAAIDVGRLTPRGLGEADPVAANARPDGADNPEGRALNRRVTIVIPKI